jgi:hypothetical protein
MENNLSKKNKHITSLVKVEPLSKHFNARYGHLILPRKNPLEIHPDMLKESSGMIINPEGLLNGEFSHKT